MFIVLFSEAQYFSGFCDLSLKFGSHHTLGEFISLLLGPFAVLEISTFDFSVIYYYTLCSCNAVGSFCAFERELPLNAVGIAGDICISG